MKKSRKFLFSLVLVMAFAIASPNILARQATTVEAAVKLNKSKVTLIKGQTATLSIKGTKKKVSWSSNNRNVATVSTKGKVTAKKKGTATITAKVGTKKYKCTVKVEAPSLSKTKVRVKVGDSYTLKLSGTTQKVTWKSSNTSVATVNSKGVISAKKAGTAKITATVLKKKYTCTITVSKKNTDKFNATEAKKNISVQLHDTGKGVVAILKNNNKYPVSISAKLVYYKDGKMLDTHSDENYAFESGRECALHFIPPYDSNYNNVDYDNYKLNLSLEDAAMSSKIMRASKIEISSNIGSNNVMAEVTNTSTDYLEFIPLVIVYYDENGVVIGSDKTYAECNDPGSVDYISFSLPYDAKYDTIYPDSYEIYVNAAYSYNW